MSSTATQDTAPSVSCDQALRIAHTDAETAYRDLTVYRISVVLEDNAWRVDYELKDGDAQGGGPHYVIDAKSGELLSKRYEQ